jgi:hypothetical protein
MFLLLDKVNMGSDAKIKEGVTDKKKKLLEEYISSFPDSNSSSLLNARLALGYIVMNEHSSISGHLSGIMDMERVKKIAQQDKIDAGNAEKIFSDALQLAHSTPHEQAFLKALSFAREVQKPKPKIAAQTDTSIYPVEEISHRQTGNIYAVLIVNLVLVVFIIFLQRKKIKLFLIKLLFRNR